MPERGRGAADGCFEAGCLSGEVGVLKAGGVQLPVPPAHLLHIRLCSERALHAAPTHSGVRCTCTAPREQTAGAGSDDSSHFHACVTPVCGWAGGESSTAFHIPQFSQSVLQGASIGVKLCERAEVSAVASSRTARRLPVALASMHGVRGEGSCSAACLRQGRHSRVCGVWVMLPDSCRCLYGDSVCSHSCSGALVCRRWMMRSVELGVGVPWMNAISESAPGTAGHVLQTRFKTHNLPCPPALWHRLVAAGTPRHGAS